MDKYLPNNTLHQRGIGDNDSKILIVIDHPSSDAMRTGNTISGPTLTAYQEILHMADLITHDVFLIPLVIDDANSNNWWTSGINPKPIRDLTEIKNRITLIINESKANIVLAMGDLSCYVLTGLNRLGKNRGYIVPCTLEGIKEVKVMPVLDVKRVIWANYIHRYYIAYDLKKAVLNSESPQIQYDYEPQIYVITNYEKAIKYLTGIKEEAKSKNKPISIDIEVSNFQISHIGFSITIPYGASIPFKNEYWTEEQEVNLWLKIADIMGDEEITIIGQNIIFDIHFLLTTNSIITNAKVEDIMMAQSLVYPDFLKGLGFLGSLYINQEPWKEMVKFKSQKVDS